MNHPDIVVYNSNFTLVFFNEEIEKFKFEIQKANKSDNLIYEIIRNENRKVFENQSTSHIGDFLVCSILENGKIIGFLNCFKNDKNTYFNLFTSPI